MGDAGLDQYGTYILAYNINSLCRIDVSLFPCNIGINIGTIFPVDELHNVTSCN